VKLIIAGGRDYNPDECDYLDLVVSGGASGADKFGEFFAKQNGLPIKRFKAEWDNLTAEWSVIKYDRYGRPYNAAAGPHRNKLMAEYADAVVLFPGGKGTTRMLEEATKAGIRIIDWRERCAARAATEEE
jgi:hypothetical protein